MVQAIIPIETEEEVEERVFISNSKNFKTVDVRKDDLWDVARHFEKFSYDQIERELDASKEITADVDEASRRALAIFSDEGSVGASIE